METEKGILKTVRIGDMDVNKDDVFLYIQHFGKIKDDLFDWEKQRKVLHDNIYDNLNLDRLDMKNRKFGEELDEYCEPHILRFDPIIARSKEFFRAKTDKETKIAQRKLELEMFREKRRIDLGFRNFKSTDKDICRICDKKINGGRCNDHLANVDGFEEIDGPICTGCSNENPDEYHLVFKKQYWNN